MKTALRGLAIQVARGEQPFSCFREVLSDAYRQEVLELYRFLRRGSLARATKPIPEVSVRIAKLSTMINRRMVLSGACRI